MREKYPTARLVIYTGDNMCDGKRKKKLILERAKERFGVDIDIDDEMMMIIIIVTTIRIDDEVQ